MAERTPNSANSEETFEPVDYPKLQPRDPYTMTAKQYIAERFNGQLSWYDKTATKMKKQAQYMRATAVIGGALVPALINFGGEWVKIPATIVSLIVGLMVSLETVYHFSDQWPIYRSTEQLLRREYYLFTTGRGIYEGKDSVEAHKQFVERVEQAIDNETNTTIRIMATEAAGVDKQGGDIRQPGSPLQPIQPVSQQPVPQEVEPPRPAMPAVAKEVPPRASESWRPKVLCSRVAALVSNGYS